MKIRKGDDVVVLAGKYRGERAKVEEALPGANKVVLDSVNIVKRHQKQVGTVMQAGIIDKFAPMHVSNVALWCGKHNGPAKAGFKTEGDAKVRVCRKCGETL